MRGEKNQTRENNCEDLRSFERNLQNMTLLPKAKVLP